MDYNRDAYKLAFDIIKRQYNEGMKDFPGIFTHNAVEAKTHRHIIYNMGYGEGHPFPVVSFRAVCEHIRAEKSNPHFEQAYTREFCDRTFCRRIVAGQNI